jgi:crotonobetainyl-CoA:carnitine CoA-transferase CaiB-like acyl-CoA transferase
VIKVERPGLGDDTRAWGPPWWDDGQDRTASYFLCANRGKRSIAIDLADPAGADLVRQLASQADVLIENYKVGQLSKYGLGWDTLHQLNPRLVYCAITGYGQDGPRAQAPGYDFAVQAAGGLMSITGEAAGTPDSQPPTQPQKVGVAVVDLFTAVYAVTAIQAALLERHRTGVGRYVDAALLDTQVAMLANQGSSYLATGRAPTRMGNAHPSIVPYQVFATADGHMVLAVGNDLQFRRLCELLNEPDWAADARFASNSARVQHREVLIGLISQRLIERSTQAWCDLLEPGMVPCAPILDVQGVFASEQVVARGMRTEIDGIPMVAQPMRLDGQRPQSDKAPPALDADGDAIRAALAAGQLWP